MNKKHFVCVCCGWIVLPHLLAYKISNSREIITKDIDRWMECRKMGGNRILGFIYLLLFIPEFRNIFYLRIGSPIKYLLMYLKPLSTLYICTKNENFGAGTYIQHGFATVITAESIGENCWINQQVTIGYNNSKKYGFGKPIIGNNVRVSAGAKVCGKITIGDDSIIGANAVAIKDVPPNSVVVPSPMMLIQSDGNKRNL